MQEEKGYLDNLDLEFSANSSYSWFLGHSGDLKSVKSSGSLSANAAAKVYLKKGNQSKLIFDYGQAEEGGIGGITGFAVKDKEDKEKDNGKGQDKKDETNQSTENESITDNLVINETNQNNNNELINQTITNESIKGPEYPEVGGSPELTFVQLAPPLVDLNTPPKPPTKRV